MLYLILTIRPVEVIGEWMNVFVSINLCVFSLSFSRFSPISPVDGDRAQFTVPFISSSHQQHRKFFNCADALFYLYSYHVSFCFNLNNCLWCTHSNHFSLYLFRSLSVSLSVSRWNFIVNEMVVAGERELIWVWNEEQLFMKMDWKIINYMVII